MECQVCSGRGWIGQRSLECKACNGTGDARPLDPVITDAIKRIERVEVKFYGDGTVGDSRRPPYATVITHDIGRSQCALDYEYVIVRRAELEALECLASIGHSEPARVIE